MCVIVPRLALTLLATSMLAPCPACQSASVQLERAVYEEETKGDLGAAIEIYRRVATRMRAPRMLIIEAQYRLGLCHLRRGERDRARAVAAFRHLVDSFPNAEPFARRARAMLARLEAPEGPQLRKLPDFGWSGVGAPSPDGRYWSSTHWPSGNLMVWDLALRKRRNLTTEGSWEPGRIRWAERSIWSPNGDALAYAWLSEERQQLRIVPLAGGQPRTLLEADAVAVGAWLPHDKGIVLWVESGDARSIVVAPTRGGEVRKLVEVAGGSRLACSPDGAWCVFDELAPRRPRQHDLSLVSVSTGERRPLLVHPADETRPVWSYDGKWIVFKSDRAGPLATWALPVKDGRPNGPPSRIDSLPASSEPVGFTKDGTFYYNNQPVAAELQQVPLSADGRVSGEKPRALVTQREGSRGLAAYATSGRHLAYIQRSGPLRRGRPATVLRVRTLETGTERELMPAGLRLPGPERGELHDAPRWVERDRALLVSAFADSDEPGFYRLDVASGAVTVLLSPGQAERPRSPCLSADAATLYYVRGPKKTSDLVARKLAAGTETILLRGELRAAALSPDGQSIAVCETAALRLVPVAGGPSSVVCKPPAGTHFRRGPVWMPDGQSVLVWDQDLRMLHVTLEGKLRNLQCRSAKHAAVRPDGRLLLCTRNRDDRAVRGVWAARGLLQAIRTK